VNTPDQAHGPAASALDEVIAAHGVSTGPLNSAISLLLEGWQRQDELVRLTSLPRQSLQELITALADDLEQRELRPSGNAVRIAPSAAGRYREHAASGRSRDPLGISVGDHPGVLDAITADIKGVPTPLVALDHVQATPETVLRRALWLDGQYDLNRCRLLFLGDHDLTSLAVRHLRPDAELTVLDVDERLLTYVDSRSGRSVRTVLADLRLGLPPVVEGHADLVFSDPPYSPEGMALFAARGISCLADPPRGRLLLAYGYSPRHPALGAQVQRRLGSLGLTFEAIIPGFHRYLGAQAIGSSADLYVCQPTAQSGKATNRNTAIYTHGPQSVESSRTPPALIAGLAEIAEADGLLPDLRRADWSRPVTAPDGTALAFDLTADPGPWLLRILLAANAERVVALLPNGHPDIGDARSQAALAASVRSKYRLRFLRSAPDNNHAVVVADAVPADETDPVARAVTARAHGKLANTAREALVRASGGTVTKNQARGILAPLVEGLDGYRLIDVPRHRLDELLDALTGTA